MPKHDKKNDRLTVSGTVIAHFGVAVLLEDEKKQQHLIFVPRKSGFVVGDMLHVQSGKFEIKDRKNELSRRGFSKNQVLAANLNAVGIVVCDVPRVPELFNDEVIIPSHAQGLKVFIVVNKIDRDESRRLFAVYQDWFEPSVRVFGVSAATHEGMQELEQFLSSVGRSILVGVSGVGKSTLINTLVPKAERVTAEVTSTKHGVHTTSSSMLYHLPLGGELIDSPGVRDFTPVTMTKSEVMNYFIGLPKAVTCNYRNCTHVHEPGCGVQEAVAKGHMDKDRYDIYVQLMKECV